MSSKKTFEQTAAAILDSYISGADHIAVQGRIVPASITRSGTFWTTEARSERRSRDRLQSLRIRRQRVRREEGQGEPPGPPVCICAIEIDQHGRETEHRLAAPYPARPPWDARRPVSSRSGLRSRPRREASCTWDGRSRCRRSTSMPSTWCCTTPRCRCGEDDSKLPGPTLIKACQRYGVAGMDKAYKEDMRALAYTKTDHTPEEIALLQDYCLEDDCRMADAAVQGDAAAHRSTARADPRRLHDGDRANALARHPDRHADLSPEQSGARLRS